MRSLNLINMFNIICKKAAWQINAIYWFKSVFDLKERFITYNTFKLSNFNYCLITWLFCGKTRTNKIEATQERALWFMFNDRTSTCISLLEKCNYTTLHVRCIQAIVSDVFESLNHPNHNFMKICFFKWKILLMI